MNKAVPVDPNDPIATFNTATITLVKWLSMGLKTPAAWHRISKQWLNLAKSFNEETYLAKLNEMADIILSEPEVEKMKKSFLDAYEKAPKPLTESQQKTACRIALRNLSGAGYLFFSYWLYTQHSDCFNL